MQLHIPLKKDAVPDPRLWGLWVTGCELPDKIVNFGTQIVKILLYRNFDESKLARPDFGRHLGFQNGRHLGPRTEGRIVRHTKPTHNITFLGRQ